MIVLLVIRKKDSIDMVVVPSEIKMMTYDDNDHYDDDDAGCDRDSDNYNDNEVSYSQEKGCNLWVGWSISNQES